MNKRHVFALLAGIVLLVVPLLSCVPKQAAAPVATDSLAYQSDITKLAESIASKADKSDTGLSKTEIQKMIDESVAYETGKLKTDQSWITAKSSTTTTPAGTIAGEYGQLVDSDGSLELWLDKTGGATDDEIFTTSGNGVQDRGNLTFVVVNKDASSRHDFKITLTFSPDEDSLGASASCNLTAAEANADNSMTFDYKITASTLFTKNSDLAFKSNERNVAKSDTETYKVYVYMTQTENDIVDWFVDYSIKDNG